MSGVFSLDKPLMGDPVVYLFKFAENLLTCKKIDLDYQACIE